MKKVKRLSLAFIACIFIGVAHAQETPSLKKVSSMQDNLILSLGLTNWATVPSKVDIDLLQSREFDVLVMGERMIPSGILGIGFGLGFCSQNVHSDGYLTKTRDGLMSELAKFADDVEYSINKISVNYIDAQLEIRVHGKPKSSGNRFKVNAGMKAGVLVQSHTKFKVDDNTYKMSGISNLRKYQYGINGRIGYGKWALGGYYSLTSIFKDNKGPDLVPYTFSLYLTL